MVRFLALLLLPSLALAGEFVTNPSSTLPGPKADARSLPVGSDASQYLRASDYNAVRDAANDLRDYVRAPNDARVTATGSTTARSLAARFGAVLNAKDFGAVGDGTTDDTAALQAWLNAAVAGNRTAYLPTGIYAVSSGLVLSGTPPTTGQSVVIEGAGDGIDSTAGSVIKWAGNVSTLNVLMKVDGLYKITLRSLTLDGNHAVGKVFWATQHPGSFSPYAWNFEDVVFKAVSDSTGIAFYVDTTTMLAKFKFENCVFRPDGNNSSVGSGKGYHGTNFNALNQTFVSCTFDRGTNGIHINGGSFFLLGCEFGGNSMADIYLQAHSALTAYGTWSEGSRQFLFADNRDQHVPVNIINAHIASYPWAYWKAYSGPQPADDAFQWAGISWDRSGPLNVIGSELTDPYVGGSAGGVAPTVSRHPTINVPNGKTVPIAISTIGSTSNTSTSTTDFLTYGDGGELVSYTTVRRGYRALTGAAFTLSPRRGNVIELTATGNTTVTMDTMGSYPGEELTLIFKQGGVGGYTCSFVNTKLAGGSFVPATAIGARSLIRFVWDGTQWNEVARSLDLS